MARVRSLIGKDVTEGLTSGATLHCERRSCVGTGLDLNADQQTILTALRDRSNGAAAFRQASDAMARLLCDETVAKLADALGNRAADPLAMSRDVMLVPILRAGLALLPAFVRVLADSPVAMLGMARDEATGQARFYYQKLPAHLPPVALILDPMLATGGSTALAVDLLLQRGYQPSAIFYTGVLASPEGWQRLSGLIPEENITVAMVDAGLDERKFIVPGLGDYGDRYWGT